MNTQVKCKDEIIKELQDIPDNQVINVLNIIRIFKKSIIMQENADFNLKKEFSEWDVLSDEAFVSFEGNLS
ncbi:MAG: hypothetical protein ACYCT7_10090 [bacterium]